jgi:hypothetical protein
LRLSADRSFDHAPPVWETRRVASFQPSDTRPKDTAQLRALAAVLEPVVAAVYFAPEAHEALHEIGYAPSPGVMTEEWHAEHWGDVMMTDFVAYFCSRGAMLGDVPGEVVAAAFGVFKPEVVIEAIRAGRQFADARTTWDARTRGGTAHLVRILGERPEGIDRVNELLARAGERLRVPARPMYAGLLAYGLPGDDQPVLKMWRLAERLREFRGDAHVAAFTALGYSGCEIQILTERVAGLRPRMYAGTRGWSDEEFDAAERQLTERGLLDGDGAVTEAGRAAREEVEHWTDRPCFAMTDTLGADTPELIGILKDWTQLIRDAKGHYTSSPQEQIMGDDIQEWMETHGLSRFTGQGHMAAR